MSITEKQKQEAEEKFKKTTENVTEDNLDEALNSGADKISKLESGSIPAALTNVWGNIKLLFSLIKDYSSGEYKEIPWTSVAAVVSAILYFVSPIDVIPDVIPVIGYLDDAVVITLCMNWISVDLEKYQEWKVKTQK